MNIESTQHARRGRPKSDEKKSAILAAAGCLFLRNGYKNTSMDAVSKEASVSKQTVYSHFQNKEELLRACVADKVQKYGLSPEHLQMDAPVTDVLPRVGRDFMGLLHDPEVMAMHRLLIAESSNHPLLSATFYEAGPQAAIQGLAAYLESRVLRGEIYIDDCSDAAELFFTFLKHRFFIMVLFNLRGPMGEEEKQAHVATAARRFFKLYS